MQEKILIKLLVADDDKLNRLVIRLFLQKNEIELDEVENGALAIDKLKEYPEYGLILMDVQMPEMTGLEATTYIREVMQNDIPIIAITANTIKEELEYYIKKGMNDYLSKPFEEKELISKIKKNLR